MPSKRKKGGKKGKPAPAPAPVDPEPVPEAGPSRSPSPAPAATERGKTPDDVPQGPSAQDIDVEHEGDENAPSRRPAQDSRLSDTDPVVEDIPTSISHAGEDTDPLENGDSPPARDSGDAENVEQSKDTASEDSSEVEPPAVNMPSDASEEDSAEARPHEENDENDDDDGDDGDEEDGPGSVHHPSDVEPADIPTLDIKHEQISPTDRLDEEVDGPDPQDDRGEDDTEREEDDEDEDEDEDGGEDEDEDEDEDGDDDEDEDLDEDDEEPVLKYTLVKNRIPEILGRDSATAIDVSPRVVMGMVHVVTYEGAKVNSFRPHAANVTALRLDEENDFVATASMEGRVVIHSLTSTESYAFDYKRPMNAIALEPGFSKKSTRAFVCGGMTGNLVLQEKGWLGYREQVLHSGEGPIWAIEWRGDLIAWANDLGVKIYDRASAQRIGYIDRGANAPRAELFKCTLHWKDDRTLVIGWADHIKIVRVRNRARTQTAGLPPLSIEVLSVWQVDCMVSGIAPYQDSGYVVLAYIPPDTYENEATQDRAEQRRKAANRPELRIIDRGDEIAADELAVTSYEKYICNDYSLVPSRRQDDVSVFLVLTPSDLIVVRPRDEADHIDWLVERERYEEALTSAEALREKHGGAFDVQAIGLKYMKHLVDKGDFSQAASLAPKVLGTHSSSWEKWIYSFVQHHQLHAIIPVIPTEKPQLSRAVYDMVLGHLLVNDKETLLETVKSWPTEIYDSNSIISMAQSELQASKNDRILLEIMAELYVGRGQPARALPFYLRLRKSNVFDLIRERNLFDAVQEQALLLVEFDQERIKSDPKAVKEGNHGAAIQLLVDHVLAIPVDRVVQQLEAKPQYLYMYLDVLFDKDAPSCQPYSDRMVDLYATYNHARLMPFLRASNFYDLERALRICEKHDFVHESVFLLGRMGDNLKALRLIIERLGDVKLAIDFAEEQRDDDLWEALLNHSDTRPDFIRALLEHGGTQIQPVRLIQRIKEGLEIPGLKPALVKVLQASTLQVSLLEGCKRILYGDCATLALELHVGQTAGAPATSKSVCELCGNPAFPRTNTSETPLVLIYLCRHLVHATCAVTNDDVELPERPENATVTALLLADKPSAAGSRAAQERALGAKLAYEAMVRVRVGSCPVCAHRRGDTQGFREHVSPAITVA